ncbi:MAG TPA: M4 family metallopeptidase [Bacteroidales bacterium]|nr:M4 family metallopeptidase [Bacteroidales bacterium]
MKKIRFTLLAAILIMSAGVSTGQVSKNVTKIAFVKDQSGWIQFKSNQQINPEKVFITNKNEFGLNASDQMLVSRTENDKLGFTHYRYQQYYQGIPVEGAEYLIHSLREKAVSGNGTIITGLNLTVSPSLSAQDAIEKAVAYTNAEKYMWDSPASEAFIKKVKKDQNATYYPKAKLVLIDKHFGKDASKYVLAYKVNVYATKPLSYKNVFIDATSGEVYHTIDLIRVTDIPGIAHTKYSGVQTITVDSTGPGAYRLRETSRCGIETYDMNTSTDYNTAIDFTDTDNNWNNVNAQQDEIATDAHFGAEATYDYYLDKFGRDSYDGQGSSLISFVHYDVDYANAFWNGTCMTYGDGDGTQEGPFTALDVCAHELTHGVTEYTANMVYQDEPGALNEAFSDIFSAAVEFYATPSLADWLVGEDFDLTGGNGFRNMSDPNEDDQPDTYLGNFWFSGTMDNGGVHYNSGVANYWFYLISAGDTGTNDLGNVYSIDSIGIEKAAQIAYRALSVYMTSSSGYADARLATIQAAIDIYGNCSNEMVQTVNAWYAVGLGMAIADNDVYMSDVIAPVTACAMTYEPVSVRMIYNGCNLPINAGDSIFFFYQSDGGAVVGDTLMLAANVNGGDTIDFTFTVPADVQAIGNHTINAWLNYANDTVVYNDTLTGYTFENRIFQNSDVGVTGIVAPVSACNLSNIEDITIRVGSFACDFLPAGSEIPVGYSINNGAYIYDTITTAYDVYPDSVIYHTFSTPADMSLSGTTFTIKAKTFFADDSLNSNDEFAGYVVKNPSSLADTVVTFEQANADNMYLVTLGDYAHVYVNYAAHHTGTKGFLMTGGNALTYYTMVVFPDGTNTWTINDFLSAKITFCVDASAWTNAYLRFDLKQTFGQAGYEYLLGAGNDYSVASNFRVLVNDATQIGGTYNPTTANTDPWVSHFIDLSAYAGSKFTVTFETRNICKDTVYLVNFTMDNAYVDNVKFMEGPDAGIEAEDMSSYLEIYPNPVNEMLNINLFSNEQQTVNIELLDLQGKLLESRTESAEKGQNSYQLDMNEKASGIYFIRMSTNKGIYNNKIIKQ